MSYYDSNARRTSRGMAAPQWVGAQIDAGLRAHMQRVYPGTYGLAVLLLALVIGLLLVDRRTRHGAS